jgi:hypothetical protein
MLDPSSVPRLNMAARMADPDCIIAASCPPFFLFQEPLYAPQA